MENRNTLCTIDITAREKRMIYKVLDNYDFKVINLSKVRSAYKVETSKGNICLKKMKHGKHKARNGSILVQELVKKGFSNTAKYYCTNKGKTCIEYKGFLFYVTDWIDGEECNLDNLEEAVECVKLLAKYHLATNSIDVTKLRIKNNLKNWPKIFNSNLHDLEKFDRIINKKKIRSEFDTAYHSYIDSIYHRGMVALNFLNNSDYYKLSKEANVNKTICHDSFYYQNIIKKDDDYYIIDLDSIIIDLHVNDLGKLIRRLMFKRQYQWSFNKAKTLIEAYNSINKLNKDEVEVMLSLIIFPHKFWKLGKKRYIKHKGWNESKYMSKLTKLIKYNELENKFLEDYLDYIDNY